MCCSLRASAMLAVRGGQCTQHIMLHCSLNGSPLLRQAPIHYVKCTRGMVVQYTDFHPFVYARRYNFWLINVYFNFQFLKEMLFAPELCLGEHSSVVEHNAFFRDSYVEHAGSFNCSCGLDQRQFSIWRQTLTEDVLKLSAVQQALLYAACSWSCIGNSRRKMPSHCRAS